MASAKNWLKNLISDRLLLFFSGLMLLLLAFKPHSFSRIPSFIHWPTILALASLLLTTTGIKESRVMEHWVDRLIYHAPTRRSLWLMLILFSAFIAPFLTNDIALFLIIPFTLSLNERLDLDIRPLLIFETIAVNVGSMLTPIGNPQNIYLWQNSGSDFFIFTKAMLLPTLIELALLIIFVILIAKPESLQSFVSSTHKKTDSKLAGISAFLLILYIIAEHLGAEPYAIALIFLLFLLLFRDVFRQADWNLIILFLLLFVDIGIIKSFHWVDSLVASISFAKPIHILLVGAGFSQIISNVPATLLLSHYSGQWKYLAWGVDIGGNGLLIASFANLIAVRLSGKHKIATLYHRYSIPYLLISILLIWGWLMIF